MILPVSIYLFPPEKSLTMPPASFISRLIRLEVTLKQFMDSVDKRFGDINKRFEDVNERFRELREDMNKRFEQMFTFLWIITGIFTTLALGVIGFAYWDRRTIGFICQSP